MVEDAKDINLVLHIEKAGSEVDIDDLNQTTHILMKNLEDMDVESVTLLHDQDHLQGAKGDLFTIGGLFVAVLPEVLSNVMEFLQKWALRNKDYVIRAKIQKGDRSAEVEYPANMSPTMLKSHLDTIKQLIDE